MVGIKKQIMVGGTVIDKDRIAPFYFKEETQGGGDNPPSECREIHANMERNEFYEFFITFDDDPDQSFETRVMSPTSWTWHAYLSNGTEYTGSQSTADGYVITNIPAEFVSAEIQLEISFGGCTYNKTEYWSIS